MPSKVITFSALSSTTTFVQCVNLFELVFQILHRRLSRLSRLAWRPPTRTMLLASALPSNLRGCPSNLLRAFARRSVCRLGPYCHCACCREVRHCHHSGHHARLSGQSRCSKMAQNPHLDVHVDTFSLVRVLDGLRLVHFALSRVQRLEHHCGGIRGAFLLRYHPEHVSMVARM